MTAHLGKLKWQLIFLSCILALGQTNKKVLDVQGGFTTGIPAGKLYKPFLLIILGILSKSVSERHTSTGSGRLLHS